MDDLISMLVFIGGFAISLGPIMWLVIAEIFPLRVRGLGASLATCVNWGSNWLVAITFLSLIEGASAPAALFSFISSSAFFQLFLFIFGYPKPKAALWKTLKPTSTPEKKPASSARKLRGQVWNFKQFMNKGSA